MDEWNKSLAGILSRENMTYAINTHITILFQMKYRMGGLLLVKKLSGVFSKSSY